MLIKEYMDYFIKKKGVHGLIMKHQDEKTVSKKKN